MPRVLIRPREWFPVLDNLQLPPHVLPIEQVQAVHERPRAEAVDARRVGEGEIVVGAKDLDVLGGDGGLADIAVGADDISDHWNNWEGKRNEVYNI